MSLQISLSTWRTPAASRQLGDIPLQGAKQLFRGLRGVGSGRLSDAIERDANQHAGSSTAVTASHIKDLRGKSTICTAPAAQFRPV
jgi:hypothetical protein